MARAARFSIALLLALVASIFSRVALASEEGASDLDTCEAKRPHLLAQASAGPTYGRLFDIPFWAGEGSIGLGVRLPRVAVTFEGHYARAESNEGLPAEWGGLRTTAVYTPGRFRVGGGVDILYFSIGRVSSSGSVGQFGAGAFAHVGFDVIHFDHGGIELAMLPQVSLVGPAPFVSGSLVAVAHW